MRKYRFKQLFQQRINAGNKRHFRDDEVAETDEKPADKTGGEHTDENEHYNQHYNAYAGNIRDKLVGGNLRRNQRARPFVHPDEQFVSHVKGDCYGHGYQNARKQVGFQFGNDIAEKPGFLLPVFNGLAQFSDLGFFHFDLILTF